MRKTTFALGLGLALSLGAADLAAQQRPARSDSARAGGQAAPRGPRGERAMRGPGRAARGPRGEGALLRGIQLTDAQKAQLKTFREQQQQAGRKAQGDQMRAQMKAARDARQKGDTAALRTLREQQRATMTQERQRQVAAIRAILTTEQRVQFDRNVAELQARAARRDSRGPGARGQRPSRNQGIGGRHSRTA